MNIVTRKTKSDKTVHIPIFDDEFESALRDDGSQGLCIYRGEDACGVEPDARRYDCESCGSAGVYGLEELLMMGYVDTSETPAR